MKQDVLDWAAGRTPAKIISKETLNHRGIIELVSGLDVYQNTPEAYRRAYQAMGIDIINRVPLENAPQPTPPGEMRKHPSRPYNLSHLGVYDTVACHTYMCQSPDEAYEISPDALRYEDLLVPVPHGCEPEDIRARDEAIGDVGLYYPLLYTTLFMWGVEALGWEYFMLAGAMDPDLFHEKFLLPCKQRSLDLIRGMVDAQDSPLVFLHDDLVTAGGPVFNPDWYDRYIFPHYRDLFAYPRSRGRSIIFVADGDMTVFLERLVEAGVDGIMYENPATNLDAIEDVFAREGLFFIGGVETVKLTRGAPDEVRRMVLNLAERFADYPGFALASCGGLHGNIPLPNLEAYLDARAEMGVTPRDWRECCRCS